MVENRQQDVTPEGADREEEGKPAEPIHLPGPSFWPLVLAAALVVTLSGLLIHPVVVVVGALASVVAIIAWGLGWLEGGDRQ